MPKKITIHADLSTLTGGPKQGELLYKKAREIADSKDEAEMKGSANIEVSISSVRCIELHLTASLAPGSNIEHTQVEAFLEDFSMTPEEESLGNFRIHAIHFNQDVATHFEDELVTQCETGGFKGVLFRNTHTGENNPYEILSFEEVEKGNDEGVLITETPTPVTSTVASTPPPMPPTDPLPSFHIPSISHTSATTTTTSTTGENKPPSTSSTPTPKYIP